MEKNIYGLLNEVETDFTEYEEFELSSQELEQHKQQIMMEVKGMADRMEKNGNFGNKNGRRKRKVWMKAAGVAAACVIAVGGAAAANPVLAKEIFSDVFGKLIQNAQGEKYEKEDTEMFTKIGENAVAVQSEVESRQAEEASQDEEYRTTVENNGVTLSVSDVYCDGYVLYYTATLKTEDERLSQADGIVIDAKDGKCSTIALDGIETEGYSTRAFDKAEDGTFVVVQQLDLMNPSDLEKQSGVFELEGKDAIDVEWNLWNLIGYYWDKWDDQGEYQSTGRVDGEWSLRFPVTIDRSGNEKFDIQKEENGIVVKSGTKTKAGLVVEVELPDFRQEPFNDPYNDPDIAICDAQGSPLQWMGQKCDLREDGTSTMQIMVLYDGQKDLSLQVTKKDKNMTSLADIGFQVP